MRFTIGQLAAITWQLQMNQYEMREVMWSDESNVDLRQLNSTELCRHLSRIGA